MSHISVMKIAFTNRDLLLQALRELGYDITEGEDLSVSDGVRSAKVDFLVNIPESNPIGFRKTKAGWQGTADWFRVLLNRKKFENALKQQYALLSVRQSLQAQGFTVAEESRNEKNEIRLVLRRVG